MKKTNVIKKSKKNKSIAINEDSATNGKRLIAYIIDWYICGLLASTPIVFIYSVITQEKTIKSSLTQLPNGWAAIAMILGVIFTLLYIVVYQKNHKATIGKKLMGLKVVKADGSDAGYKEMFMRGAIGVVLVEGALVNCSYNIHEFVCMTFNLNLSIYVTYIFQAICIISVIIAIIKPEKRMIHDYIGNTKVIKENKN